MAHGSPVDRPSVARGMLVDHPQVGLGWPIGVDGSSWVAHGEPMGSPWVVDGHPTSCPWVAHEYPTSSISVAHGYPIGTGQGYDWGQGWGLWSSGDIMGTLRVS